MCLRRKAQETNQLRTLTVGRGVRAPVGEVPRRAVDQTTVTITMTTGRLVGVIIEAPTGSGDHQTIGGGQDMTSTLTITGTITDTMGKAGTMRIGISMTEIAMTTGDVVTMATGMMSMTTDMVMTTGQPEVF